MIDTSLLQQHTQGHMVLHNRLSFVIFTCSKHLYSNCKHKCVIDYTSNIIVID